MSLVQNIKDNDYVSIRQAIAKLSSSKLGSTSSPTFAGLTLTELTASKLVATDSNKTLTSDVESLSPTFQALTLSNTGSTNIQLSDITNSVGGRLVTGIIQQGLWIETTTNHPLMFAINSGNYDLIIEVDGTANFQDNDLITTGTIDGHAGKVLVEDNDTSAPSDESDGYVGVAKISDDGRIYFKVDDTNYYISGTYAGTTGSPIGLLLALTYS